MKTLLYSIAGLGIVGGLLFLLFPVLNTSSEIKRVQDASASSQAQVNAIFEEIPSGTAVGGGYALKSRYHDQAYWVTGEITERGEADHIGVWLITGTKGTPLEVYPVDVHARDVTRNRSLVGTEAWSDDMSEVVEALEEHTKNPEQNFQP